MLIIPGFWPDTYWSDRYWPPDYWPEFGEAEPPPEGGGWIKVRRRKIEDDVDIEELLLLL